ncbi:MAG TPA: NUDIX hydrolase [Acidobacteriota bacterium]|nr:NUDIX hydrolase [Acidobacteriota bacterium]
MAHLETNVAEYAIIFNEKKEFLLLQWSSNANPPSSWHFPGGRMDVGEREISGLERELKEEIAAQVTNLRVVYTRYISTQEIRKFAPGARDRYAVFYTAKLKNGSIPKLVTTDHVAMKWHAKSDLSKINFWLPFYKEMMVSVFEKI